MSSTNKRKILVRQRKKMKLTQQDVADIIDVHVSTYSNIERGVRNPSFKLAVKIADLYDISIKNIDFF